MNRQQSQLCAAIGLTFWVGACADGAKLPEIPKLVSAVPGEPMRAPGSVSEVYARIAQGTRGCWFGSDGALKTTHIFHADMTPASRGEVAEITVHEYQPKAESRWGKRVFLVTLHPADGQTAIAVENLSMPDPVGGQMRADVFQWSQGGTGCTTGKAAPETPKEQIAPEAASKAPLQPKNAARAR